MVISPLTRLASLLGKKDHAGWVIFQQIFLRGLMAGKFIVLGRLIGPEAVGLVGVALLAIAVAESLSDTGLPQSIVQRSVESNSEQLGAIWTLLVFRGLLIGSILLTAAPLIADLLHVPSAISLISTAAVLPVLRNALGPGYYLAQRERNFRRIATLETAATAVDFVVAYVLVRSGFGPIGVVLGAIIAETIRLSFSWLIFPISIQINCKWRLIRNHVSYGKWIWGSSALSLILNHFDKILVTRLLGATEFGLYQMAYKFSQLMIADAAVAMSQYLFPTFCEKHRISPEAGRTYFHRIIIAATICTAIFVAGLMCLAPFVVLHTLGLQWMTIVPLIRVLCFTMAFGAIIAVMVVYARAIGRPELVTQASAMQVVMMLISAPIAVFNYGVTGMAWALSICVGFAILWIFNGLRKS